MASSAPIIDNQRWFGLDIFENFNDVFFMALMFLIGGFFIIKGLQRKGPALFIRDRFYRLFVPFIVVVSSLILLAYYPAFLNGHPEGGIKNFLVDFFTVEKWPPGPPWFIWVLFLFNLLYAGFSRLFISLTIGAGNYLLSLNDKPFRFAILFFAIAWLLYVPASWIFGAYTWTGFGPFVFQKSRLLLYFGFFFMGTIMGTQEPENGLFSSGSGFIKKWPVWLACCIFFYLLLIAVEYFFPHGSGVKGLGIWGDKIFYGSVYTLSTCFSCIAFLTIFGKFATRPARLWNSLCENAYCIYLNHYIFVLWSQFELLHIDLPALVKFLITFIISLLLSWMAAILLRKIPVVKTYI